MNWADLNLIPAAPEMVLATALFTVLLVDLWLNDRQRWITYALSILAVALTAAVQWGVWVKEPVETFSHMFVLDGFAQLAKMAMYAAVIAVFVYSKAYVQVRQIYQGEFYTLSLFGLLGMCVMVSANHFLTLYVGLEILSLSLYALIALRREDGNAAEAALKYFVLGALASGLLLYGISLIYGATGSLQLGEVLAATQQGDNPWLLKLGLVFVVVAIAFKLGAVPFHMWVPDVYQGAPTAVAALVGTAPKIAATVFTFRILVTGLGTSYGDWTQMFQLLAIASLLVGNLAAIMQTNIKRMLAYSTISHMGFILLAFMGGTEGFAAAMYYAITYALMGALAFGVLMLLSDEQHECENIADLAGLNQKNAWYAFLMLLAMFSMAGIPPLMGFYAKFAVIKALLGQGHVWVSVFAVVMSLIGAFYYLRVVKTMYFDEPSQTGATVQSGFDARLLLSVNALLLLAWGVMPQAVVDWCIRALQTTL
ncbi:NADH-quinone oxidoreductase subunit NuoN [Paralysiella testudinis]|uniref:NADH-quinone oxidoreductase subunit N n=1 Tax=Paralysiella testudinis TaxID=2809020 RepID=A0A892ZHV0_9NEIS|nr:NADH-quinone oxidoreductase subunit NuoN [Paralysiella testudinis]QRQ82512.1 NADH-quinone oxidoreductase subunit NuoN [Paralysiella testudinis]